MDLLKYKENPKTQYFANELERLLKEEAELKKIEDLLIDFFVFIKIYFYTK